MKLKSLWDKFTSELDKNPALGFDCPVCMESFKTQVEKTKHLNDIHDYLDLNAMSNPHPPRFTIE